MYRIQAGPAGWRADISLLLAAGVDYRKPAYNQSSWEEKIRDRYVVKAVGYGRVGNMVVESAEEAAFLSSELAFTVLMWAVRDLIPPDNGAEWFAPPTRFK